MFRFRSFLPLIAVLALCPLAQAQITSLASPPCAKPIVTLPVGSSLTVTWVAPTQLTDGTTITDAITYNLYSLTSANPTILASGLTTTSSIRSNLTAGTPCYAVTAIVNGVESVLSNTAAIIVAPTPAPKPPSQATCSVVVNLSTGAVSGNCTTQ